MTDQVDETGVLVRSKAPVSGISVPGHLGIGTDLVHSLDYVVMLQVLFNIAAGEVNTPRGVWKQLQDRGIRSAKNANELVGKNAVYEAFARLITAGYLRRIEVPNEVPGRRPTIAYEVFDNPAWNPAWQATKAGTEPLESEATQVENAQVNPLPGTPDVAFREANVSAGQPTSLNAGSGVQGSGVPERGKRAVPAGQPTSRVPERGKASPPHPPEEEGGTPSPSPLKPAAAPRRGGRHAAAKDVPEVPAEAAAAAAAWLRSLPGKWAAGLQRSQSLAPWLVHNAELTGWQLDLPLRLYLTRNEAGKKPVEDHGRVLAYRIQNMQERAAVMAAAEATDEPETPEQTPGGLPPWCGTCNGGQRPHAAYMRTVETGDELVRCPKCHPAVAARRTGRA